MLDVTLTTQFVTGTNLKGDMASADWRFLLPRLQFGHALCLGLPPLTTLCVLSKTCQRLWVVSRSRQNLRQAMAEIRHCGMMNVAPVLVEDPARLPYCTDSFDLVFVSKDGSFQKIVRDHDAFRKLGLLLKSDGVIYFELGSSLDRLLSQKTLSSLSEFGLGHPQIFRLTPRNGEMQTAIPVHDTITTGYFRRHLSYTPSLKRRVLRSVDKLLGTYRRGVVAQRSQYAMNGHLPQYLVSLAREAGAKVESYCWGMSAPGHYNSKKILFYLIDPQSGQAKAIIKLTRSPVFNCRLENEYRALYHLSENHIVSHETIPYPLFFGYRGNIAVLGQKIIQGRPFRQVTQATINCLYAKAAMDWLVALGAGTADSTAASSEQVAEAMARLFQQLVSTYKLSIGEQKFMNRQIEAIRQSTANFPVVFQHGDPGIWNIIVTDSGKVAFLDWEAAERHGMPLWDLFYFFRSYGTWMSRVNGIRDSLKSFTQNFLMPSEIGASLLQLTHRYCEQIHLDKRLIEPIFYMCWMHRALKETTRLTPAKLEKGHYINLLRLCITEWKTPALARLFS